MKHMLEYYTEELRKSQARLKDLNRLGEKALSRYDVEIANGGDTQQVMSSAKRLLGNHISYFKRIIAEREKQPKQLTLIQDN